MTIWLAVAARGVPFTVFVNLRIANCRLQTPDFRVGLCQLALGPNKRRLQTLNLSHARGADWLRKGLRQLKPRRSQALHQTVDFSVDPDFPASRRG